MRFEWVNVRPGVIALSGTPFHIRRENLRNDRLELVAGKIFTIYEHDAMRSWSGVLSAAKSDAERMARELIDLGLIEVD